MASYDERNSFGKFKIRTTVQRRKQLSIEFEGNRKDSTLRPWRIARIAQFVQAAGITETVR